MRRDGGGALWGPGTSREEEPASQWGRTEGGGVGQRGAWESWGLGSRSSPEGPGAPRMQQEQLDPEDDESPSAVVRRGPGCPSSLSQPHSPGALPALAGSGWGLCPSVHLCGLRVPLPPGLQTPVHIPASWASAPSLGRAAGLWGGGASPLGDACPTLPPAGMQPPPWPWRRRKTSRALGVGPGWPDIRVGGAGPPGGPGAAVALSPPAAPQALGRSRGAAPGSLRGSSLWEWLCSSPCDCFGGLACLSSAELPDPV